MKILNFQQFRMPAGINRAEWRTGDAREAMADLLYKNVNGIAAHRLAFKIYESNSDTEYSDEEALLIVRVAEAFATPAFIDGLNNQIDNQPKTD